ncbi:MAG: sensor domain-containing protein [Myxococcota bacterium]
MTGLLVVVAAALTATWLAREGWHLRRRRQTRHALQDHLRRSFDASLHARIVTDAETGRLSDANAAAESLLGRSREELIGMHQSDLHPEDDVPAYREMFRRGLGGEFPDSEHVEVVHADGRRIPVRIRPIHFEAPDGRRMVMGVFQDIRDDVRRHVIRTIATACQGRVLQGAGEEEVIAHACRTLADDLGYLSVALLVAREAGIPEALAACPVLQEALRERRDAVSDDDSALALVLDTGDGWIAVARFEGPAPGTFDGRTRRDLHILGSRLAILLRLVRDRRMMHLQSVALESSPNGVVIADPRGRIEWTNQAFVRQSGYGKEELRGESMLVLRAGMRDESVCTLMWQAVRSGRPWQSECTMRRKDGGLYTVELTVTPTTDEEGMLRHMVAIHHDVTGRKEAEARVLHLQSHDPLTNLPNRTGFLRHLEEAVYAAWGDGAAVAALLVDVHRLQDVNATFGEEAGDTVLRGVAERLQGIMPPHAMVARMGGDDFGVVLQVDVEDALSEEKRLADSVLAVFERPFEVADGEILLGVNVGIATTCRDCRRTGAIIDPDRATTELVEHAESALHDAIGQGRNAVRSFEPEMLERAQANTRLGSELAQALERDEIVAWFQPQVDLRTGRIVGVEALARWHHPTRGMVSPGEFVPVAEATGLVLPLGRRMLRLSCEALRGWDEAGLPPLFMAVNVSGAQLLDADFVGHVERELERSGLPAGRLELELTETMLMRDTELAVEVLDRLRALGVQLAIDDFGTGYSSLAYLQRFRVHKLKIDRTFVDEVLVEPANQRIVGSVVDLGHGLGARVIAEGVEEEQQVVYLRAVGCDEMQGYLVSRPVPADDLAALVARGPRPSPAVDAIPTAR